MTQDDDQSSQAARGARKRGLFHGVRASFLTGLVVIAPIGLTVWLMWTVTGWIDSWVLPLVPEPWQPEQYIGINLRGVGVIIFLIFTAIVAWTGCRSCGRSTTASSRSPKPS